MLVLQHCLYALKSKFCSMFVILLQGLSYAYAISLRWVPNLYYPVLTKIQLKIYTFISRLTDKVPEPILLPYVQTFHCYSTIIKLMYFYYCTKETFCASIFLIFFQVFFFFRYTNNNFAIRRFNLKSRNY